VSQDRVEIPAERMAGNDNWIICPDPASGNEFPHYPSHFPQACTGERTEISLHINRGRSLDHNLDRNGADDGTGATAAIGATDIRPHDGSSGSGRRHSNRA